MTKTFQKKKFTHKHTHIYQKDKNYIPPIYFVHQGGGGVVGEGGIKKSSAAVYHSISFTGIKANWGSVTLVLLVKCNTLILYAYFLQTFMLLLVSVTLLPMHKKKKKHSNFIIFATVLDFCENLVEVTKKNYCWHLFVSLVAQIFFHRIQNVGL